MEGHRESFSSFPKPGKMAEKQIIRVTIDPKTKQVTFEGKGFKGKGCTEAIAKFAEALGNMTDTRLKPEAYQDVRVEVEKGRQS